MKRPPLAEHGLAGCRNCHSGGLTIEGGLSGRQRVGVLCMVFTPPPYITTSLYNQCVKWELSQYPGLLSCCPTSSGLIPFSVPDTSATSHPLACSLPLAWVFYKVGPFGCCLFTLPATSFPLFLHFPSFILACSSQSSLCPQPVCPELPPPHRQATCPSLYQLYEHSTI